MRKYDSPLNSYHMNSSLKFKDQESPMIKLTNSTDGKASRMPPNSQKVLMDRSNEAFIPKNASKYIDDSYQINQNRERQIQQIRKKYYVNSDYKNRSVSQKYDRQDIHRGKDETLPKRDINAYQRNENQHYGQTNDAKRRQNLLSSLQCQRKQGQKPSNQIRQALSTANIKRLQQDSKRKQLSNNNQKLDNISQASNSNYETINRTLQTFSPQTNRTRPPYMAEDLVTKKRKNDYPSYCLDSAAFGNGNNRQNNQQVSQIREVKSICDQSGGSKNIDKSYKTPHNQSSSAKSTKIQSRVESYISKPFTIEQTGGALSKFVNKSTSHTIYDNYLPKTCSNDYSIRQNTTRKASNTNNQYAQDSNKRNNLTEQKRDKPSKVQSRLYEDNNDSKKRVLQFQDSEGIRQIQRRLKERQVQLKNREQDIKSKYQRQQTKQDCQFERRIQGSTDRIALSLLKTNEPHLQQRSTAQQRSRTPKNKPDVQKQIQRLSQKIKQFEDRKKQLNISYKANECDKTKRPTQSNPPPNQCRQYEDARKTLQQFRYKKTANSTHLMPQRQPQTRTDIYKKRQHIHNGQQQLSNRTIQNNLMQKQRDLAKRCQFIQNTRPVYSQKTLSTANQKRAQSGSKFAFKLFKIQSQAEESSSANNSKISNISSGSSKSNNVNECRNQFQIQKRTDDGIEQRRKKLQENNRVQATQSMKKLVSLLSQQSIFDQEFRNCKIWFHTLRDQNKWRELKRNLRQSAGVDARFNQLKDGTVAQFLLSDDQNNPFFSVNQQSKFTYQALVKSFVKCKTFWQQNFLRKFDKNSLRAEGFSLEKIDMEKKGFINLQDFVRFLNFQSGNFYRNRDLYLIFMRFLNNKSLQTTQKALSIDKIFKVLTN